jgi:hypothetical protein
LDSRGDLSRGITRLIGKGNHFNTGNSRAGANFTLMCSRIASRQAGIV